jgi:hypothetical protein
MRILVGSFSAGSIVTWTRSIGVKSPENPRCAVTLLALASLLSRWLLIGEQAREVSNRMFGTFGGDFLEQMVGKVGATDWCVFDRVMQQNNSPHFEKGG